MLGIYAHEVSNINLVVEISIDVSEGLIGERSTSCHIHASVRVILNDNGCFRVDSLRHVMVMAKKFSHTFQLPDP